MIEYGLKKDLIEAGCDEAGRGCLAGPVVAAAVILPKDFRHELIDDSKKLSEKKRMLLRSVIEENALAYEVCFIDNEEIDQLNILRASITAMQRALKKLTTQPEHILIDGNKFYPFNKTPHTCVIGGDGKYAEIAAASILAKTYRDEFMLNLHEKHPEYDWKKNKGYPTKAHREALAKYGITPYHRSSFRLFNKQMTLKF